MSRIIVGLRTHLLGLEQLMAQFQTVQGTTPVVIVLLIMVV